MQIYRGMAVGTAAPTPEETEGVPAAVYMAAGAAVVVAAGIVIVRKGRGSHE